MKQWVGVIDAGLETVLQTTKEQAQVQKIFFYI